LVDAAAISEGLATTTALSISPAADTPLAALPFGERRIADAPTQAALLALVEQVAGRLAEAGS
jgi:hypothetical protein